MNKSFGRKYVSVLFLDVVDYSGFMEEDQGVIVSTLNGFYKTTLSRRQREISKEDLSCLPTGDGMAIVFPKPEYAFEPIYWAWEFTQQLKDWTIQQQHASGGIAEVTFEFRIGLHRQSVQEFVDLRDLVNYAGPGMNFAQRVMDCGRGGHILASHAFAADAEQSNRFSHLNFVRLPADPPIKGGRRIPVYNIWGTLGELGEAGNKDLPKLGVQDSGKLYAALNIGGDYAKSSLANCFSYAHFERLNSIDNAKPIRQERVWNQVSEWLKDLHAWQQSYRLPITMELVSLISPVTWTDSRWQEYQRKIAQITTMNNVMARRLHVRVEQCVESEIKMLVSLMLSEFICSIKARLLILPQREIESIPTTKGDEVAYKWKEFFLLDAGTYYADGGKHLVILSDINPFRDKQTEEKFNIYDFNTNERQYIYDDLQANFYRAWDETDEKKVMRLPAVIRKFPTSLEQNIEYEKILELLPPGTHYELTSRWKEEMESILKGLLISPKDSPNKEEEDLFHKLITLRRPKKAPARN